MVLFMWLGILEIQGDMWFVLLIWMGYFSFIQSLEELFIVIVVINFNLIFCNLIEGVLSAIIYKSIFLIALWQLLVLFIKFLIFIFQKYGSIVCFDFFYDGWLCDQLKNFEQEGCVCQFQVRIFSY